MKLRKGEYCLIHRSRSCCGREQEGNNVDYALVFSGSTILITPGDIGNCARQAKCRSY